GPRSPAAVRAGLLHRDRGGALMARPWLRRAGGLAAGVGTGLAIAVGVGTVVGLVTYLFLRTEAGNEVLRRRIEAVLEDLAPYGNVTIGRLETDLFDDLALYDVRITDEHGDTVVFVERALADV